MRTPLYLLVATLCLSPALAQERPSFADSAAVYFREIKTALQQHQDAWGQPLYGPLHAAGAADMKTHLAHALTFRKYRYRLYAGADTTENQLELNEGLAEYTGQRCSGRDHRQTVIHIDSTLRNFLSNLTFIRSFAYQTIPIYGYLLQRSRKNWQHDITATTNLTDYFINAFSLSLPADPETAAGIANQYNGPAIMAAETERAVKKRALVAAYKARFIEQPHLEIRLEKMNISFNPGNMMPLEDKGTVYPNMRVSDRWGILEVQQGALMAPGWDKISLSAPEKIAGNQASGEGWTLQLNDGWQIIKDPAATGNYLLTRQ